MIEPAERPLERFRRGSIPQRVTRAAKPQDSEWLSIVNVCSVNPDVVNAANLTSRWAYQCPLFDSRYDETVSPLGDCSPLRVRSLPLARHFGCALRVSRTPTTGRVNLLRSVETIPMNIRPRVSLRDLSEVRCSISTVAFSDFIRVVVTPLTTTEAPTRLALTVPTTTFARRKQVYWLRLAARRARPHDGKRRGTIRLHRTPPTFGARPRCCLKQPGASSRQLYQINASSMA